jgi:hypothetical protein
MHYILELKTVAAWLHYIIYICVSACTVVVVGFFRFFAFACTVEQKGREFSDFGATARLLRGASCD